MSELLNEPQTITVQETITAPIETVWTMWTLPNHILKWNFASEDWMVTHAENDLRVGGDFSVGMAAKDGSAGFDFEGTYIKVVEPTLLEYMIKDGRKVSVMFEQADDITVVTETFDAEHENSIEKQRSGWQSILRNFKRYVESNM